MILFDRSFNGTSNLCNVNSPTFAGDAIHNLSVFRARFSFVRKMKLDTFPARRMTILKNLHK